jgi:hypothetical protein
VVEIEGLPVETYGPMTVVTVVRQLPEVDVLVARCAEGLERFVTDRFRQSAGESAFFKPMALVTAHLKVLSGKPIARVIVVTDPSFEPLHDVAIRAVPLELPPMRVVSMAIAASREGDSLEPLLLMAFRASQGPVPAAQWISGPLVIEGADFPGARLMTSSAVGSQGRLVGIAMAVRTTGKTEPFPLLVRMTLLALQYLPL